MFSIQALNDFEDRFGSLTLELDRAQAKFELAEVKWISLEKKDWSEKRTTRELRSQSLRKNLPEYLSKRSTNPQEATHEDTNDLPRVSGGKR